MKNINIKNLIYVILSLALAAALLSPLASGNPDGLDWTIEKHAAAGPAPLDDGSKASGTTAAAAPEEPEGSGFFIFSDYKTPFINNESASTVVSGFAGIALILLFFKFYGPRGKNPDPGGALKTGGRQV
jgi:hypothetical protein